MRRLAIVGLAAAALLSGCAGGGSGGVPVPPPPTTFLPGDTAPPPAPASPAPTAVPFASPSGEAGTGFGATSAAFVNPGADAVTNTVVSYGRIAGFTLVFAQPIQFYDALRRVTAFLPPDTTIRYVQSPTSHLCRQVEFRSLTLNAYLAVPAVLVNFYGHAKKSKTFAYNAVSSATFQVWPLGDRSGTCG